MAQAADAGVGFTFQGRSAEGADNWAVTDGHIAVFGDGGGYGDGRVSIGLADIDSGTNLVGPGARKACYSPLPGFPVRDGCLHAKALGVRLDGERLCLALQPGSNLQNLLFSQIACAPNVASDLGQTGARITGVLPPTFVEGDPDYLMAVAKGGDSFPSAPCDVILMRTAGGATGPVQYWDGNSFSSWRAAAKTAFTTASCGPGAGVFKEGQPSPGGGARRHEGGLAGPDDDRRDRPPPPSRPFLGCRGVPAARSVGGSGGRSCTWR